MGIWFVLLAALFVTTLVTGIISVLHHHLGHLFMFAFTGLILFSSIEVGLLLKLRSNVVNFSKAWSATADYESPGLVYVALGDSAAQGVGASSIDRSYVHIISQAISRSTGRPVTTINLSRSGAKLADVLRDQIPQLAKFKPALITVDVGSNDITAGTSQAEMVAGYPQLAKALQPYNAIMANIPDFMWGTQQRNTNDLNIAIKEVCARYNVQLADLHTKTNRKMWGWNEFAVDGFHPSNAGYKTWASAFLPLITDLLAKKDNH